MYKPFYSLALNETRGVFFTPVVLPLDRGRGVQLSITFTTFADHNDTNTPAIEVPRSEGTDATETTRTEVDCVSSSLGEVGRTVPVQREREDLVAEFPRDARLRLPQIRT